MPIIESLLDGLPPQHAAAPIRDLLIGPFWTIVVLDTLPVRSGLASTLRGCGEHTNPPIPEAGCLLNWTAGELAQWARSEDTVKASAGLAACNALLQPNQEAWIELNASEIIRERGRGRQVAIIGHFPFVEQVREAAEACWVLELNPRPGDIPAHRADEFIPEADVVAVTSTSLINHTFDGLIDLCREDALVVLLGPSTPLSPLLFEWRVDVLSGTVVEKADLVTRSIAQGATFRQIKARGGLRLVSMAREGW